MQKRVPFPATTSIDTSHAMKREFLRHGYRLLNRVGAGSSGQVYLGFGVDRPLISLCFKLSRSSADTVSAIRQEMDILLATQSCPYIIDLLHMFVYDRYTVMVFPALPFDLLKVMCTPADLVPKIDKRHVVFQLCQALAFVHARGYLHCDIKPENILVDEHGHHTFLADFGLSVPINRGVVYYRPRMATLPYRCPHVILGATYDQSIDMWSVGCVMVFVLYHDTGYRCQGGRSIFHGDGDLQVLSAIFRTLGSPPTSTSLGRLVRQHYPPSVQQYNESLYNYRRPAQLFSSIHPDARDLLLRFLHYDPARRISAADALKHKWFSADL